MGFRLIHIKSTLLPSNIVFKKSAFAQTTNHNSVVTTAADFTGVNFIFVTVSFASASATMTLASVPVNTFTLVSSSIYAATNTRVNTYYCYAPTVLSTMTFTATQAGTFPAIAVGGWSGVLSTPLDQTNTGVNAGASPVSSGSISPMFNNTLVISGLGLDNTVTPAPNNAPFANTICALGATANSQGIGVAWYIQGSATPGACIWSWTGGSGASAQISNYKST